MLLSCRLFAQYSGLRHKKICPQGDTVLLDSATVVPGSVIVKSKTADTIVDFYCNPATSQFYMPAGECCIVQYRVFPFSIGTPKSNRQLDEYSDSLNVKGSVVLSSHESDSLELYQPENKLTTDGSISRGFSVGNNQDVILNSSLNLQVDGELTDNVKIKANITDSNIPVQGDGTSQQLEDFDQVYINIYTDKQELVLGDFTTTQKNGSYLKYNKKAQGARFEMTSGKNGRVYNDVSIAVSKGKYCSQDIEVEEGNQGPYKIYGCDDELYIVVLSGSEKVYGNGKLLTRGEDNDYVMDYNSGEIEFTENYFITEYTRIKIEFEYADQNYSRVLFCSNNSITLKNAKVWCNVFSENDNKNSPLLQDLTDDDILSLTLSGDNNAYTDGGVLDTSYDESTIYYERHDTTVNSTSYSIYVQSSDEDAELYQVTFSYAGDGEGDYDLSSSSLNGNVYEWTAPNSDSTKNGSYNAVSELVAPVSKQVISIGGDITLDKNTKLSVEFAGSRKDANTFSDLDSDDDYGYVGSVSFERAFTLRDSLKKSGVTAEYRLLQKDFSAVNAFRDVEYERDWNIESDIYSNEQDMGISAYYKTERFSFTYSADEVITGNAYRGNQNTFAAAYNDKKNSASFKGNYLITDGKLHATKYIAYTAEVKRVQRRIQFGAKNDYERDEWVDTNSVLDLNSEYYNSLYFYISNNDSLKLKYSFSATFREDKEADTVRNVFTGLSKSRDLTAKVSYNFTPRNNFLLSLSYRQLSYSDSSETPEENILGRFNWNLSFIRNLISISNNYKISSGLESKKQYTYVEVTAGEGVYKWDETTDYNNNGIAELNEFEIATYEYEANYVKVQLPTDEYQKVKTYTISSSAVLDFSKIRKRKKAYQAFLRKWYARTTYRNTAKYSPEENKTVWFPAYDAKDTLVISQNTGLYNSIKFNSRGKVFKANYFNTNNLIKTTSLQGYTITKKISNRFNTRLYFLKYFTFVPEVEKKREQSLPEAGFLQNKNYTILSYIFTPELEFQPGVHYKASTAFSYKEKDNLQDTEHAELNDIELSFTFSHAEKGRIKTELHYINILYNSDESTSVAYKMLEGLDKGKNYTWSTSYQRKINKSIQMQISYSGRKSESSKIVHSGSVVFKAFF